MILYTSKKIKSFVEKDKINCNKELKLKKIRQLVSEYESTINYGYLMCTCGHDKLYSHGSYTRNIYLFEEQITIKIKRVKCTRCRKKHSIIPSFIKPFFNYESSYIDFCITKKYVKKMANKKLERFVSRQLLRKWIIRLEKHISYILTTFKISIKEISKAIFTDDFIIKYYFENKFLFFDKTFPHNIFILH